MGSWNIREKFFWVIDSISGSPIKKAYNQIKEIRDNNKGNKRQLLNLLNYAVNNVPFYKNINPISIKSFPVVNKTIYKSNYEEFRSLLHLDDSKLLVRYTGGSTGTPFRALQDKGKQTYHKASLIDINNRIGWNLGDRFLFVRYWDGAHNVNKLNLFMKNMVTANSLGLNNKLMEDIRRRLITDKSLQIILGYSSALGRIADYLHSKGDNSNMFNIKIIISDTDTLTKNTKDKLEEVFGCTVFDRYANNENGILAMKCNDKQGYIVNNPEFYIELLRLDSDEAAPLGEIGRIVITDLYNRAFPFIRYDTGDLGIALKQDGDEVLSLKSIVGRSSDALVSSYGDKVFEVDITAIFEDLDEISRFQVVQIGKNEYNVNLEGDHYYSDDYILMRIRKCLGDSSKININYLKKIPNETNGKFKTIINLYSKSDKM